MPDPLVTIITGIFNGLGTAIGSYFGTKYAIRQIEKHEKNIKTIVKAVKRKK